MDAMINKLNPMTWQAFKSTLEQNPDLNLQFQYDAGKFVDRSFHIAEIKQAPIVSVDCGGVMHSWTEVIVQLWEPPVSETKRSMLVSKALRIVNLVEKSLPLNPNAIVKIEFGNSKFDTRQMYPDEFLHEGDSFIVNLAADFTQCKALTRDQSCGTGAAGSSCCDPAPKKEKSELVAADGAACKPGSGCSNYQSIITMKRILVLCTGNSARSQLAQGYLQYFAGDRAEVYSAGVDPKGVNPVAIQVMAEDGLDISHHTSNHADEYTGIAFDYAITVCDNAREQCPYFPSAGELIHHSFSDPGHTEGEDLVTSFRRVRDEIKAYSREFINQKLPA